MRYEAQLVRSAVDTAERGLLGGQRVLIVNSPFLNSEIGHALVQKGAPAGLVWHRAKGRIKVSLRSGARVDVSRLAQRFGGGGHKRAAGFAFPATQPFPWKAIKK